jgi:hypothetical protein
VLVFDVDGKKSAQEPVNRDRDGQLHEYMRQATQLIAVEFKVKDTSHLDDGGIVHATDIMRQMVVLDASGWSGEGRDKNGRRNFTSSCQVTGSLAWRGAGNLGPS